MFFIKEGEWPFGAEQYPVRKHDDIACPTGGPEVGHQFVNTGSVEMRDLTVSTLRNIDICVYPDSNNISVVTGRHDATGLRKIMRAKNTVDYYDRERNE